eukprot:GHUV01048361.1.p1 GENE.GHUV01048361.1~~GHUV01048361.1.p1  ORF type:complete len:113 (+),score=21.06 GHUV01048361.1:122-460(+)
MPSQQVDLEASCKHHRATYSNPAEFTLIFTGKLKFTVLLPLLTTYLATIPAAEGRGGRMDPRKVKPLPFRFPDQPVLEDVEVRGSQSFLLICCFCSSVRSDDINRILQCHSM